jgi:hypothetical protein
MPRAARLGVNPKTLSNQMRQQRLVEGVQRAVRGLVLGLSRADRRPGVAAAVRPRAALTDLLREARADGAPGLEPAEAAGLLGGLSGAARAG